MIKNIISIICAVVGVVGALISGIWTFVLHVKNPDATGMRILIDNPELFIVCIISLIILFIGGLTSEPRSKRKW